MAHNVESPYGVTGVGLNLAHDFAILHGGDITVADNKGGARPSSQLHCQYATTHHCQ